jgi:hypothetical protein
MKVGFGQAPVAVTTGGLTMLQEVADASPVVPLVFIAYLFFKAWLDYRVQVKSLPATEPGHPVRGASVVRAASPAADADENMAS